MNIYLLILIVIVIILIYLLNYIFKNIQKSQLRTIFIINFLILIWICSLLVIQYIFNKIYQIPLIYFEYLMYIGTCFLPISMLFTGIIFTNTKIRFKKSYLLLFIIPIISLIILWTNNLHHLFYINYSINMNETKFGIYNTVYLIYTYLLLSISIFNLLRYSLKNAGFFSKQSMLIIIGTLIPIIINILGTYSIVPMTIYLTPISFAFAILCYAIAIFKFNFLSVTPIAMQRVVDRMSDSFLVVNEDNIITDFNNTFLKTFKLSSSNVRNINFVSFILQNKLDEIDDKLISNILQKCKTTEDTILVKRELKIKDKYFNVEASGIFSKNIFLGTLILLKDVTQHIVDKQAIEDKQSMLLEKERLASLGQMIGGIAHNLKTPIMSISGAAEGLSDLTKEYNISIGDPQVTNEDHHAIVKDMDTWIRKIREYTEYMSDVITAVKGQAVAFSEDNNESFTISELIRYVNVLMKHELKSALISLNTNINVPENLKINGNINSLVQVVNNMISNSIQAYNGKTNMPIDFTINKTISSIIISVKDYGCGMPKDVKQRLFKEMITTKGKNGTGLGLFMSYSNIRAHFNGDVTFESEEGKGTRFDIILPIK